MPQLPEPEYIKLPALGRYASASRNTLKIWLDCGMPHYRIGRSIRVKVSEFDEWMAENFRVGALPASEDLDKVFEEAMREAQ